MKKLTPDMPEYRGNGYYVINGIEYYSVWTFKKTFRNDIDNTKEKNTEVTNIMNKKYGESLFKGLMEVGEFKGDFVQLHKKVDLEDFLPPKKLTL